MYLYIFREGPVKTVRDNPTTLDYVAVAQGLLCIVKHDGRKFVRLVRDENKFYWVPVQTAQTLSCKLGRFNQ